MTNIELIYTNTQEVHVAANGGEKEVRACTVHALSIVAQIPWGEAQALLRAAGRQANKGFNIDGAARNGKVAGYTFTNVMPMNEAGWPVPQTLARFVRLHPRGRYYVTTGARRRAHAFAIVDGKLHDWLRTAKLARINRAWTVTKTGESVTEQWDPLSVLCTKCHAGRGRPCVRANGKVQHNTHRVRRETALRLSQRPL
jgi:hypothetical protein